MTAIQSKQTGFPLDMAMRIKLAERINPGIFNEQLDYGYSVKLVGILKTEVLEMKDRNPHAAAHYHVAVHYRNAFKSYRKRGITTWEAHKVPREQMVQLSIEMVVITRDDILLPADDIMSAMKYKFHANVLLLHNYSVLKKQMDLPMQKHMTEKQKASVQAQKMNIFNDFKKLFKMNDIFVFFMKELQV